MRVHFQDVCFGIEHSGKHLYNAIKFVQNHVDQLATVKCPEVWMSVNGCLFLS